MPIEYRAEKRHILSGDKASGLKDFPRAKSLDRKRKQRELDPQMQIYTNKPLKITTKSQTFVVKKI